MSQLSHDGSELPPLSAYVVTEYVRFQDLPVCSIFLCDNVEFMKLSESYAQSLLGERSSFTKFDPAELYALAPGWVHPPL